MPIRYVENEVVLEGVCAIEEVDELLQFLEKTPSAKCNLVRCEHMHTAVLQTLIVRRVRPSGEVYSPFLWKWIVPLLRAGGES